MLQLHNQRLRQTLFRRAVVGIAFFSWCRCFWSAMLLVMGGGAGQTAYSRDQDNAPSLYQDNAIRASSPVFAGIALTRNSGPDVS
jgi:hypothetical protein